MKLIQLLALAFFLLISCSSYFWSKPTYFDQFSVLQGSTDAESTVIRVIYPESAEPRYLITDADGKTITPKDIKTFSHKSNDYEIAHLFLEELKAEKLYTLSIESVAEGWKEKRTFKTLNSQAKKLKFMVASCMSDAFNEDGNHMWDMVWQAKPDVLFLIGDNAYADIRSPVQGGLPLKTTPASLYEREIDHAMTLKIYRMPHLIPTFSTWDDHDYGINNGGKNYKYKKESLEIFRQFFPGYNNKIFTLGHGVSSQLKLAGQNFLFLDNRSFRDHEDKKDGYHFGSAQRAWIQEKIKSSTGLNWIISGDQFFGAYHSFESFEGLHPIEFEKFKKELRQLGEKYVFITGDRHLVEVIDVPEAEVGHHTFEYTVSGIQTKMFPGSLARDPNPKRVDGFDGLHNFAIFEVENSVKKTFVNFKAYAPDGVKINSSVTY